MFPRCAIVAVAILLAPAAATAQVSDADRATARVLAEQGKDAFDRKDFATAVDRFRRAVELVYAPTLALGLARSLVADGKLVAAQETYNRILREGLPVHAPPVFAAAVAGARAELSALEPRVPSAIVTVEGAPAPRVTLDGAPLPRAALDVTRPVDPGTHVVRAEAEGCAAVTRTMSVSEGKAERVRLTLSCALAIPPPDADNARSGPGPLPAGPAPSGSGPLRRTLGFVGIGVGGAALVLGGVAGGLAIAKHGALAKVCTAGQCMNQESGVDAYNLMGALSTAGFVAGSVLAGTGVVLVATAPRAKAARAARVAPVLAPAYAGLAGRF